MMILSLFIAMGIFFVFLIFALGVLHFLGVFNKKAYQQALKLEIFIGALPAKIKKILKFVINFLKNVKQSLIFKIRLMANKKSFRQFMKNNKI